MQLNALAGRCDFDLYPLLKVASKAIKPEFIYAIGNQEHIFRSGTNG